MSESSYNKGLFISVVIPCYKTATTMVETLESVLAQGPQVEIIVVNDGSPDNTAEIAAQYGDRIRYHEQENNGVASARNLGLQKAQGKFVLLLDADDKLLPGMADAFLDAHKAFPAAHVLYSDVIVADDDMNPISVLRGNLSEANPLTDLLCQNKLMPQGTIIRTETLRAIGGLDTPLNGVDDWDLWVRLASAKAIFRRVDVALSVWRFRTGSQSKQFFHTWNGHRSFFRKHKDLYRLHTTKAQLNALKHHILDRDLPHLYGNDLRKSWIQRRVGRTGKLLQIAIRAPDLLPYMFQRTIANWARRVRSIF